MTSIEQLEEAFDGVGSAAHFRRRPDAIPGDLRIGWRVAVVLLVIDRCWGRTASSQQVHFITWALRSQVDTEQVERWFSGHKYLDEVLVRYDPSTSRSLNLCVASGLAVRKESGAYALTQKGKNITSALKGLEKVLVKEKTLLGSFPGKVTRKQVSQVLEVE